MKFRRIDDDTVRCIVSKEDMQEYGIVLEDFFKNKGKIHDFLHEVVERAEQEVGYSPKEGLLSMQIMPISQNTISITFTEQGNSNYGDIIENLRESVNEMLEDEEMVALNDDSDEDELDEYEDDSTEQSSDNSTGNIVIPAPAGMEKASIIMIAMQSIDKMANFCRTLNIDKTVNSELYRMNNKDMYCLIIEKNRLSANVMRQILLLAVEYTSHITDETKIIAYIREYGEVIIDKSAYRILKKYV